MQIARNKEVSFEPWRIKAFRSWKTIQQDNAKRIFILRLKIATIGFLIFAGITIIGAIKTAQYRKDNPIKYENLNIIGYQVGMPIDVKETIKQQQEYAEKLRVKQIKRQRKVGK